MSKKTIEITTHSADETIKLGRKIGAALRGGQVIAFIGDLGSGKTCLIKGVVLGLEARDARQITSPTFVLVNEYVGRGGAIHIYHIDAYRIETLAEFAALGFEEYCRPDSVVLIEWADKILPALEGLETIDVHLEHISKNRRKIVIQNPPEYLLKTTDFTN